MTMKRVTQLLGLVALILGLIASSAFSAETLKIATLTDMSGPYAELAGWGNINAAKMAIEDFGGKVLGMDLEYVYRDHQSKADMANQKAIELYEKEKVDVIFDCPNSAAGLAVSNQALRYKKLFFAVTSGTTRYTGDQCNRYTFHWAYNDYVLATAAGTWAADNLGKKWYTITADYAWGHDLLKHFSAALQKRGGTLLGNEMVALGASDFSPYLIKAMNAKPEVVALLNAGKEVANAMHEYQTASDKMTLRSNQIEYLRKSVDYTMDLLKYTSNTNYTDVLTSEERLLSAQLGSINDKLQQLQALVELYRSLGGGWK